MAQPLAELVPKQPAGLAFEQHFTPKQLAKLWSLGVDLIRRAFENEPGVVHYGRAETMHKRKYDSMRIPASVAARVHQRLTKPLGRTA